jgi:hypothetical protein
VKALYSHIVEGAWLLGDLSASLGRLGPRGGSIQTAGCTACSRGIHVVPRDPSLNLGTWPGLGPQNPSPWDRVPTAYTRFSLQALLVAFLLKQDLVHPFPRCRDRFEPRQSSLDTGWRSVLERGRGERAGNGSLVAYLEHDTQPDPHTVLIDDGEVVEDLPT